MNPPFFSVIIPAYNHEMFIENCIESVSHQSFNDFEILFIDDGSTDSTELIVNELSINDKRIKYIKKENGGVASARNFGIINSNGGWICFLDSDDLWYSQKLAECYHIIIENEHINAICHDENLINESGEIIGENIYRYQGNNLYKHLLFNGNCLSPSAFVVKKIIFEQAGYFNESKHINTVEDYDLWIRIAKLTNVYSLHKFLGAYRFQAKGISNDYRTNFLNTIIVMVHNLLKYKSENELSSFGFYLRSRKSLRSRIYKLAKTARKKDRGTSLILIKELMLLYFRPLSKVLNYKNLWIN